MNLLTLGAASVALTILWELIACRVIGHNHITLENREVEGVERLVQIVHLRCVRCQKESFEEVDRQSHLAWKNGHFEYEEGLEDFLRKKHGSK